MTSAKERGLQLGIKLVDEGYIKEIEGRRMRMYTRASIEGGGLAAALAGTIGVAMYLPPERTGEVVVTGTFALLLASNVYLRLRNRLFGL